MYRRQYVESMSEPVAEICADTSVKAGKRIALLNSDYQQLPIGTKLYLGPQPADAETLRDAERYRWLRKHGPYCIQYEYGECGVGTYREEACDEAIDAAIKGDQPK